MLENNEDPDSPVEGMLKSTVLKAPHHGSNGSSSLKFLKAVKPEWAVITAGIPHGHPTSEALARLKHADIGLATDRILRTDAQEDGTSKANETNLGDDCYIFYLDQQGIVKIEKWDVKLP